MNEIDNTTTTEPANVATTTSALEAAIEAARGAKPGRPKKPEPTAEELVAKQAEKDAKVAEKAEKKATREATKAEKNAERDAKRAEKKAARELKQANLAEERLAKKLGKLVFKPGQTIKVVTGELAGIQGIVAKCARLRVHIQVEGQKKLAYCFVTDCAPLES